MRALASEADVETRYGGRYVQSVNGIEGSLRRAARLVLVRERLRGRPQRRRVQAARRRRRLVGLPRVAAGGRGARRRRRVPRAVPARVRGEDPAGGRPVRACAGAPRGCARATIRRRGSAARLGTPVPEGANVLELRRGPPRRDRRAARRDRRRSRCGSSSAGLPAYPTRRYRFREPRSRSRAARRRRHRGAARPTGSGRSPCWPPCSSPSACARPRSGAASTSSARSSSGARRPRALAVPLVEPGRDGALGRADDPGARPARRDDDGALRGGAERAPAGGARARVRGLRAPARPRPARRGGRLRAPVRARGRAGDAPRALARARRGRARGGGARPRRRASRARAATRRCSRRSSPARSSARRNLAEAMEARGFGRSGVDAGAAAAVERARPARARRSRPCSSWWRRCGSSRPSTGLSFSYPAASPALGTSRSTLEPGEVVALLGPSGSGQVDAAARARRARAALPRRALRGPRRRRRVSTRGERGRPSSPARSRRSSRIPRTRS